MRKLLLSVFLVGLTTAALGVGPAVASANVALKVNGKPIKIGTTVEFTSSNLFYETWYTAVCRAVRVSGKVTENNGVNPPAIETSGGYGEECLAPVGGGSSVAIEMNPFSLGTVKFEEKGVTNAFELTMHTVIPAFNSDCHWAGVAGEDRHWSDAEGGASLSTSAVLHSGDCLQNARLVASFGLTLPNGTPVHIA